MAYRRNNYDFVIDSNFSPFSMQEMLTPFVMYKDAYEKTEEAYNDLTQKADTFKYLADVVEEDPDSKAAKIYKGYANELDKQAKDLAKNGLSMLNRRALTNLKRRYQGEIGMLARADEQLKELQKQRNALIASGKSMLYANDNPTLDDFLEGNESFNRYSIDQDALRALGMQEGQAASSRIYGSTKVNDITKYYQEILQTQGYSPELINQFRQSLEAIPEFRDAVNSIMEERGINQNLKGVNWQRAKDSIVNGIIAGSVYKEARNAQPNPGVMTAAQMDDSARGWAGLELSGLASGYKRKGGKWVKDESIKTPYTVTNSGNPVYLDEKKRPYALGSDGITKYYDNDKDGNYTDANPFVKPTTVKNPEKIESDNDILQRTGGRGIMLARKGGSWISATTDQEYSDAGWYFPIIDNIWGTRSKLIDWGGDWNLTDKASGKYRYIGPASKLPLEAIQSIQDNDLLPSKANLRDYDVYGVKSREGDPKLSDEDKFDYVLWPKGQPFPYNVTGSDKELQRNTSNSSTIGNGTNDIPK